MIVVLADEGTLGTDPQPQIPVEAGRHGIGYVRPRSRVTPATADPGVDFLDPADGARLHKQGRLR